LIKEVPNFCYPYLPKIYKISSAFSYNFISALTWCNTACTNVFLRELSKEFQDDVILLCCDGAAWHKSNALMVPDNIKLFFIPPYTPEMNPIEQIWKELKKRGFKNEVFSTLEKVADRLCDAICSLTPAVIHSITSRKWIIICFNQ